ncbi:hypothetical protein B0T13DRAFT_478300 [Neurospora crassa]|nr:hypothetical protein B0T13DRAFT_478300 [Neurospora crassa]
MERDWSRLTGGICSAGLVVLSRRVGVRRVEKVWWQSFTCDIDRREGDEWMGRGQYLDFICIEDALWQCSVMQWWLSGTTVPLTYNIDMISGRAMQHYLTDTQTYPACRTHVMWGKVCFLCSIPSWGRIGRVSYYRLSRSPSVLMWKSRVEPPGAPTRRHASMTRQLLGSPRWRTKGEK